VAATSTALKARRPDLDREYFRPRAHHATMVGPSKGAQAVMTEFSKVLETFENRYPHRDYKIEIVAPEFTSLCPKTGQPDFGTITITYTPAAKCVELKSLKFYLQSFRNEGIFYEHVTNAILDDLVAVLSPRWMKIQSAFNARGGMTEMVTIQYAAAV
jgi:7-cyano-7-deazaguanine reductase